MRIESLHWVGEKMNANGGKNMQINKIDWNSFKLHQIQLSHEKCEANVYLSSLK